MSKCDGVLAMGRTVKNGKKWCNGCKRYRRVKQFTPRMKRGRLVLRARCQECEQEAGRAYNKTQAHKDAKRRYYGNHPEQFRKEYVSRLAKEFDMTGEELERWLAMHSRKGCEICGVLASVQRGRWKKRLHLDHDEIAKRLCGALCNPCNLGLGHFLHNPQLLRKAAEYVERTRP